MLYSDSLREMMQNGLNESFWDGLGVEIGPCANFTDFPEFQKKYGKSGILDKIRLSENYLELDALGKQSKQGARDIICPDGVAVWIFKLAMPRA